MLVLPGCLSEFETTYDRVQDICVSDGLDESDGTYGFSIEVGPTSDRTIEILEEGCTVELVGEGRLRVTGFSRRLMKDSGNDGPIGNFHVDCNGLSDLPPGEYAFDGAPGGPITLPLQPEDYWCVSYEWY